jgi:hypothetical protein
MSNVMDALQQTFERRGTHPIPSGISEPAAGWSRPYAAMARECGLDDDIMAGFQLLKEFFKALGRDETGN